MSVNIKLDVQNKNIVVGSGFYKKALDTSTGEYKELEKVMLAFPKYDVVVRTIKKNTEMERYKGLKYGYMLNYILSHEPDGAASPVMSEYLHLQQIAQCHSKGKRYQTIKKWFLNQYPEIAQFGVSTEDIPVGINRSSNSDKRSDELPELKPAA